MAVRSTHATGDSFTPVAIIGVGLRAPGNISDLESLWDTLVHGKSHHARMASDPRFLKRFDPNDDGFRAMFDVTPDARDTLHGNLLDETPGLDRSFFGISERESMCMDVQQKLLLHVAHEALEDAGYNGGVDGTFDKSTFGVYVASATDDFEMDPYAYPMDIYHLPRAQRAFLAGQISHHFGFHGPAVAVDTVCAGSMTALNDACRSLATGECNVALAGGVHVVTPISAPPTVMSLKLAGFLDPTGQCKPFLASGKGYCRSEGCGITVLKRLDDAVRDGDRIHGVIRGMGVGLMSAAKSIVRPDAFLQSIILRRALSVSGVGAADISFVEAHGPGTQAGDPAELESICSVLAPPDLRPPGNELVVGSIKGNIGHAEAASGCLSLFKVLAMMRFKSIPAQPDFTVAAISPNLQVFFQSHAIRIASRLESWEKPNKIAAVNNFGASGYAGSMIVEQYSVSAGAVLPPSQYVISRPILISAKTKDTLALYCKRYALWLHSRGKNVPLRDISFTTTARRPLYRFSVLVHGGSHADLAQKLTDAHLDVIEESPVSRRCLALCFSGQGGPPLDPRETSLYEISASFKTAVDECFEICFSEHVFADEDVGLMHLFALQYGLSIMWKTWGLKPSAVTGHSFGEYAALVFAGVMGVRDALLLIHTRAALIRGTCMNVQSCMAAVRLSLPQVEGLLRQQKTSVELALVNSHDRVTLAGMPGDLELFREELLRQYPSAKWQLMSNMHVAFHSRFVEPALDEFDRACKAVPFSPPTIMYISGVLGRVCFPYDNDTSHPKYLVNHCRQTIQFAQAIQHYQEVARSKKYDSIDWVELGPHSTTIGFIPTNASQLKLPSLRKDVDGWSTALQSLIRLRTVGHVVDFPAFQRDTAPTAQVTMLPAYPFKLNPHTYRARKENIAHKQGLSRNTNVFEIPSETLAPILHSHVVAGQAICPASVYVAFAVITALKGRGTGDAFTISRLTMSKPFASLQGNWLKAAAMQSATDCYAVEVRSRDASLHASMLVEPQSSDKLLSKLSLLQPIMWKLQVLRSFPETCAFNSRYVYSLFSLTVKYSEHWQGLQRVWVTADGREAWAISSGGTDDAATRNAFEPPLLHDSSPIIVDRACQLIGFLINSSPARGSGEIFVASEIDEMEFSLGRLLKSDIMYSYASFNLAGEGTSTFAVGQVYTFDQDEQLIAAFRGVRMRKMKQHVIGHLVNSAAAATSHTTPSLSDIRAKHIATNGSTRVHPEQARSSHSDKSAEKLSQQVLNVFKSTLGLRTISVEEKLCDLGLDSLTAVEAGVELERFAKGHKLEPGLLLHAATTVQTVLNALGLSGQALPTDGDIYPTKKADRVFASIGSNPELLQEVNGTVPLVLIHDGGGTALAYRLLGTLERTLLGIHSPGLVTGQGIPGIREAAQEYARLVRQWLHAHNEGVTRKVMVGGWSLGGIIAYALAVAEPDMVAGVILIDSPPPGVAVMTPEEVEALIPFNGLTSNADFQQQTRKQLVLNAHSLRSDDARFCLPAPVTHTPVYVICAAEGVRHSVDNTDSASVSSCSLWMTSTKHAQIGEEAWRSVLGDCVVGASVTPGDHFSIFTPQHSSTTTDAIRNGANFIGAAM